MNPSIILANFYLRHVSELRAFLLMRVGCREIAAELAQEIFVRIMNCHSSGNLRENRAAAMFGTSYAAL